MAWRFKVSKYKNAVGVVPRKEDWLSDIKVGSPQSCGNLIKASAAFMAFNVENRGGGSLGVMPLSSKGRFDPNHPLLHAHSDLVTDFDFSPFDDGMLATGSTDACVHIWHIPTSGLESNISSPEYSLPQFDKRVENVLFHPTTEFILSIAYYDTIKIWDILHQKEISCCQGATDQLQSTTWRGDGSMLASSGKDRVVRLHDPRAPHKAALECNGHQSAKDSRIVWLGDTDSILSTGYSSSRIREMSLRDVRAFDKPVKTQQFDASTGILMPLYDADTRMLFLAGKADVSIMYWEVTNKEPYLTEGLKHTGSSQTKGACLVPKRGLDVMAGEVNRVLQLTPSAVIPITYQVPRKTYREFHSDLFPDTRSATSAQTIEAWVTGGNAALAPLSLDPGKRHAPTLELHRGVLSERHEEIQSNKCEDSHLHNNGNAVHSTLGTSTPLPVSAPVPVPAPRSRSSDTNKTPAKPTVAVKPSMVVPKPAQRSSVGNNKQRSGHATNGDANGSLGSSSLAQIRKTFEKSDCTKEERARNLENSADSLDHEVQDESCSKLASIRAQFENRSSSEDSNAAKKESEVDLGGDEVVTPQGSVLLRAAPASPSLQRRHATTRSRSFRRICKFRHLKGTAGHRSSHIENLRDLSRTTPGESDGIACNSVFVVLPLTGAGGRVTVLQHQKGGRLPDGVIPAFLCGAAVQDFAFDPFDEHRLFIGCDDGNVQLWRVPEGGLLHSSNEPEAVLYHTSDKVFSMSWSPCGVYLATLARDGLVRVLDPRKSGGACREGPSHQGVRGGRILWANDGNFIITCGASKSSQREVCVYRSSDLSAALHTLPLDQSPAILMPTYDPDSCTLFLTAKGESTIHCYEVGADAPYLFPLSHHKASSVHQGLTFLPKHTCDVRAVEFARALRLTHSTLEPLSFTVPRVKTNLFQDDVFPPTAVTWQPRLSAAEWFSGLNRQPLLVSLQPADMDTLSSSRESPPSESSPAPSRGVSLDGSAAEVLFNPAIPEHVRHAQSKLEHSMSEQISVSSALEQDHFEGVEKEEWTED
ncbi:coronin-7 [Hyalella azteca]|uniref:Coronin n=1 Tax=Hyalella azteca TaxID=294128 RepID=A0A8B7PEI6_HYAAZ|nr:coronin-7 [Hyalella azteca]